MEEITGRSIPEATRFLHLLSHPEVIELLKLWITTVDEKGRCLKYEAPWNCAKEAEAYYENVQYGWLGGASGVGYNEHWCENCRKKIMEG